MRDKNRQFAAHLRGGPKDGEVMALPNMTAEIVVPVMMRMPAARTATEAQPMSQAHQGTYRIGVRLSPYSALYEWEGASCPYENVRPNRDSDMRWGIHNESREKLGEAFGILAGLSFRRDVSSKEMTQAMLLLADVRDELRGHDKR